MGYESTAEAGQQSLLGSFLHMMSMPMFIILGIFLLLQFVFIVRQQQEVVIERLGKYSRTVGAGLNFKIPFLDRLAYRASLQVQPLEIVIETKTKDDVFVKIKIAVQYAVKAGQAADSFYKLRDHIAQMKSYVLDVVRAKVPVLELDETFAKKDDVAANVKENLADKFGGYGFEIHDVLVVDIDPDPAVKAAMNEIQTQRRLQVAAQAQGDAQKTLLVKSAEAESEAKKLQGEGIAQERMAIAKGIKESLDMFRDYPDFDPNHVMQTLLLTQHFDTMKSMGKTAGSKVIFMPSSPDAVGHLMSQIQTAITGGAEAAAPAPAASARDEVNENRREAA